MDFFTGSISPPEFPDGLTWLNLPRLAPASPRGESGKAGSPTLTMAKFSGKVVLIDFWTYSCINCQRTLPYLKRWWDKYANFGFVLIGVHSPEFDFEKKVENVKEALKKYQVTWPVVLDNDMKIWNLYANHYWPAKYLVDYTGKIIFTHFGEGNYVETELKIQSALKDAGFKIDDKLVSGLEEKEFLSGQTPELYFGSVRGQISLSDRIYTIGKWRQEKEYLQHDRETKDLDDLIILSYRAKKVYLVMGSARSANGSLNDSPEEDGEPIKVYVTLDGVGLTRDNAGEDVKFDSEGRSYVEVQFSTLYNLVSTQTFGDHVLRLSTLSDRLRCFAFTFGS